MKVVHEGRGGYVEFDGRRYGIEHIDAGHFSIDFPSREPADPAHLAALVQFAASRNPAWSVENNSELSVQQGAPTDGLRPPLS